MTDRWSHYRLTLQRDDVDVNYPRFNGEETPLIVACQNGHLEVMRELLKHKNVDVNRRDENNDTPLANASRYDNLEVVRELLKHKNVENVGEALEAAVTSVDSSFEIVCELMKHDNVNVNYVNGYDNTPLIIASWWGDWKIACELLKHNDVDVNIITTGLTNEDVDGYTKIPQSKRSRSQILKEILNPEDWELNLDFGYLKTPLIVATLKDNFNVACELLKHDKVDVNIGIEDGYTPLIWQVASEVTKLFKSS